MKMQKALVGITSIFVLLWVLLPAEEPRQDSATHLPHLLTTQTDKLQTTLTQALAHLPRLSDRAVGIISKSQFNTITKAIRAEIDAIKRNVHRLNKRKTKLLREITLSLKIAKKVYAAVETFSGLHDTMIRRAEAETDPSRKREILHDAAYVGKVTELTSKMATDYLKQISQWVWQDFWHDSGKRNKDEEIEKYFFENGIFFTREMSRNVWSAWDEWIRFAAEQEKSHKF